uniref:Chemotaxis protein CheY, Imidazole glycerol phosphate synthase subunit HisF chimera n=1 Tax=Thermotoga maritima TaxID=2336 RepID=UPI000255FF7C|nr:Chain A, Chemotaxis protein CheY, Imidazole glycerol phosphate synthase subunit HisF chimera [Thermotoga maritima]
MGKIVLIVDDATNGREAVEKYKELKPDIVTMDITMPEMNGIDAIKEIMKIDPNAKIIVCSAMGQQAMVIEAIKAGAKGFIVNTAAVENPSLITQLAQTFGSQAVVVAIDAKRVDGEFMVFTYSGKKNTGILLRDWVVEVEKRGAGEILLTSIDRDGTKSGYDTEMIRFVRPLTTLPIIASGGAGKMEHFLEAFLAGADAAAAASVFHFREIDGRELKEYLKKHGVNLEHHHHHH